MTNYVDPYSERGRWQHERSVIAEVLRDWLHETPMSQCDRGSDTCGTWPLAYEVADKIMAALHAR